MVSEDPPDDSSSVDEVTSVKDSAVPDASPAPEPAPEAPEVRARPRRVRLVILGAGALAAIALVIVIAWTRATPNTRVAGPLVKHDGGAAISAPKPPQLPGDPISVQLTGFVVDGSNAPVVGAVVAAELEKGAADRPVAAAGGDAGIAVASIINRSGRANPFEDEGLPFTALAEVEALSWDPAECPLCKSGERGPAVKPGSRLGAAKSKE